MDAKLSNGKWHQIEQNTEWYINEVLEQESWVAPRENRDPMTCADDVLAALDSGAILRYGTDWYESIRASVVAQPATTQQVKMTRCSCGHTVAAAQVMNASLGTSCPDCYDRMST